MTAAYCVLNQIHVVANETFMIPISLCRSRLQVFWLSAKHMAVRLPIASMRIIDLRQIIFLCLVSRLSLLVVENTDRLDDLRAERWWLRLHFQGYLIFCIQYHWILILTTCFVNISLQFKVPIVIAFALVELLRLLLLSRAYKLLVLLDTIIVNVWVVRLIHGQGLIRLILWYEVLFE